MERTGPEVPQRTHNSKVAGSIPAGPTTLTRATCRYVRSFLTWCDSGHSVTFPYGLRCAHWLLSLARSSGAPASGSKWPRFTHSSRPR